MNLAQSSAVLSIDTIFTWHSKITEIKCQCCLRIYKISFDKVVVIVSELPNSPGCTIAEEALTLIELICHKFELKLNKTMFLEHYSKRFLEDEEIYEHVMLTQGNVWSSRINKQKLEALLSVKLEL